MILLARTLKDLLNSSTIDTTNWVWRLHSRVTVIMLAGFTILVTARAYFGEPIECITNGNAAPAKASLNSFCWTLGTYISRDPKFVFSSWDVIELSGKMGAIPPGERFYQKYYQWVPFMLAIQVLLFSLPKMLWRLWERERMFTLCCDLTSILEPPNWDDNRRHKTFLFLMEEPRRSHRNYVLIFALCETMNLLVVIFNVITTSWIFGGFWESYRPAMMALFSLDMDSWISLNSLVFPKLAKCDFHYIGPSGSRQTLDALCLLPQNLVNEKIFAVLWVWFVLLSIVSFFQLWFRIVQFCSRGTRQYILHSHLRPYRYSAVRDLVRAIDVGTWFLLYKMAGNINRQVMREIVTDMVESLNPSKLAQQSVPEQNSEGTLRNVEVSTGIQLHPVVERSPKQ